MTFLTKIPYSNSEVYNRPVNRDSLRHADHGKINHDVRTLEIFSGIKTTNKLKTTLCTLNILSFTLSRITHF